MSKNKFNKSWMKNHLDDPFVKMAQKEGYRARAAYKLIEIDEDAHLIKPGQVIVDLGSTPGSWSQYVVRKLGSSGANQLNGTVIGLDLLPMEPIGFAGTGKFVARQKSGSCIIGYGPQLVRYSFRRRSTCGISDGTGARFCTGSPETVRRLAGQMFQWKQL